MEIIAYLIVTFTTIQLIVSFINLIYIKFSLLPLYERLKSKSTPLVSILIPARNEEKNIGSILDSIIKQNYSYIEIIVLDDQSTDNTKKIVKEYLVKEPRIKLIESTDLPENWLGKNFACHTLSTIANGDYLLFVDADVNIEKDLISRLIALSEKYNLGLISIFPHQKMFTLSEKITVPIIYYILLSLLPLILVRISKYSSISAANGQLMLFKTDIYKKFNLHYLFRNSPVEDIDIARFLKKNYIKIMCITGIKEVTCRMYDSFKNAINGFSKNIIRILGNNSIIAIMFWFITTLGFVPLIFISSRELLIIYLFQIILIRIFISITINQNTFENLILIPLQQIVLGLIILIAVKNKFSRKLIWKERNIY